MSGKRNDGVFGSFQFYCSAKRLQFTADSFTLGRIQESGARSQEDLVITTETVISQNPLNIKREVQIIDTPEALSARDIYITEPNDYKGTVFIKSNLLVDTYSDDLASESRGGECDNYDTWLRLKEQIRMTRKIVNSEYRWNDGYGSYPIIRTDAQGKKFVGFIADSTDNYYETALLDYPYYGVVELGLEKPFLELPLTVKSALQLYTRAMPRYTGSGETVEHSEPVVLPLQAILKTAHSVKVTPPVVTLDEDNNYTSFVAVEANEGANWTLENVDPRITVTPSSGTGRMAAVVRKADSFDLTENFIKVPLHVVSLVDAAVYPDIDGEYEVSDMTNVHLEQYTPTRNALIPKMDSDTSDGVTIVSIPNDTASELNAEFTWNSSDYAVFALSSTEDILTIDTGEAVVLDKIEIRGQNIRRLIAQNTYKGGAALSFSLYGTNDPDGTWIHLRNGNTVTDIPANTNTTSTLGSWAWGSNTTVAIHNGYAAGNCPWCGAVLTFCTTCGKVACPEFNYEDYYNYGSCSYNHDWNYHYDTSSSGNFTPPENWATAYRSPLTHVVAVVQWRCSRSRGVSIVWNIRIAMETIFNVVSLNRHYVSASLVYLGLTFMLLCAVPEIVLYAGNNSGQGTSCSHTVEYFVESVLVTEILPGCPEGQMCCEATGECVEIE